MKILSSSFIILLLLLCAGPCPAQTVYNDQTIKIFHLTDGTTLKGFLIKVEEDGRYLIDTTQLGEVLIDPNEIINMTAARSASAQPEAYPAQQPAPSPSTQNLNVPMQEAQKVLMSDPVIMESIQQLMADPETMQLLQDPSLLKSLTTMDPEEMQANPKVQELMNHPIMQEIIERAKQRMIQQDTLPQDNLQP